VYVSGQLPFIDGKVSSIGAVPSAVSLDNAKAAARQCALNALAIIADALKEHGPSQHGPSEPGAGQAASGPAPLDRVVRVVRLGVFVCSDAGFTQQPQVANGASELMEQVFGEAGRHARAAVGSIALPLGASVEVEVLVEVR
jgi:enamine deaminase RidA (YjgF/YER057c/UK114 family)